MKPSNRTSVAVLAAGALMLALLLLLPGSRSSGQAPGEEHFVYIPIVIREVPPLPVVRFAVIGDYGSAGAPELAVSSLVKSWSPDFIVTTGDNNYPDGSAATIDQNIGQYYQSFIAPYSGSYGEGSSSNRFFPALGNHDWVAEGAAPYLAYFSLPENERYYSVAFENVRLFVLDSDLHEPDGVTADSTQGRWLQDALSRSTACWNIVTMHHPPYSSGSHGSTTRMQWPYVEWGADMVLAGHDHSYERILRDGATYIVNGLGGHPTRYAFGAPVTGSQVRFNANHGALLVEIRGGEAQLRFDAVDGQQVDSHTMTKACP